MWILQFFNAFQNSVYILVVEYIPSNYTSKRYSVGIYNLLHVLGCSRASSRLRTTSWLSLYLRWGHNPDLLDAAAYRVPICGSTFRNTYWPSHIASGGVSYICERNAVARCCTILLTAPSKPLAVYTEEMARGWFTSYIAVSNHESKKGCRCLVWGGCAGRSRSSWSAPLTSVRPSWLIRFRNTGPWCESNVPEEIGRSSPVFDAHPHALGSILQFRVVDDRSFCGVPWANI